MELLAFEVQVCAKTETRGLEMAFLVKEAHRPSFLCYFSIFRANQIGFEKVFDNLTFKHMGALRKQIQSLVDYVLNHCFWTFVVYDHKD